MGNVSIKFEPRNSLFNFTSETSKISLIRKVKGFPSAKNMAIRGENLAALAALKAGAGISGESVNVDIIYIDPPYNVGGDQGYNNKWKGVSEKERHWAGDHGRFLDFMEPRLKIGRSLLKDDGIMFVSICDGEYCRLKILMDEVFGESNCLGTIIWNKTQGAYGEHLTAVHEYVLVYAKNKSMAQRLVKEKSSAQMMVNFALDLKEKGLTHKDAQKLFKDKTREWLKNGEITKAEAAYNLLHPGTFIPFQPTALGAQDKPENRYKKPLIHPVTGKKCKMPNKNWKHCEETLVKMAKYDRVYKAEDFIVAGEIKYGVDESTIPRQAFPLTEAMYHAMPTMISIPHNQGKRDLPEGVTFTTPKPVDLMKELIKAVNKKDAVVLDYFGGSGATAHAVDSLNKEDGGSRRWITIEEMNSTFNLVMLKRFEACFPGTYCTYELQTATVEDKELMKVFSQYSKEFIASYHFLNTDIASSEQGMTIVGYDENAKCVVAITNPTERKSGRIEKELQLLKKKIQEVAAKKVLIYTISDGTKGREEPWKGLDKSVLAGTTCKELKVIEIPDQLVKEWKEVLTAMAA